MPANPDPTDPLQALSDEALVARLPHAAALPDAPLAWQARAVAAWRAPTPSLGEQVQALRQRILAALSFDSWAGTPLAAGLRSTGSATRQLVFSAEGRDVDLRITPQGAGFAIRGQVLGPDESGTVTLEAEADAAGPTQQQCPLDELGEFHLGSVAPGRYSLHLLLAAHEIALPAFDVGPVRLQPPGGATG
jgi:hypothetical protein